MLLLASTRQLHGLLRDYLRRSFARFKLCAHFLNLRCLIVQTRHDSFHSFLLLRRGRLEVLSLLRKRRLLSCDR
jgi:hypothetical protein